MPDFDGYAANAADPEAAGSWVVQGAGWWALEPLETGEMAALAHGIEKHRPSRVVAHIAPANTASIAVSTKLGMKYETDVDFFGEPGGRYLL